jgi:hypothetical protein
MLTKEKDVLNQLFETSSQRERLLQALLTNLTWLRKCAKELCMEEEVRLLSKEMVDLKRREKRRRTTSSSRKNLSIRTSSTGRSGTSSFTVCQAVDANASGGTSSHGRLRQSEQALLTPGEHQSIAYQLRKSQTL